MFCAESEVVLPRGVSDDSAAPQRTNDPRSGGASRSGADIDAPKSAPHGPALRRWLREPLLHFIVLGLLLFAVNSFIARGRTVPEPSRQIDITVDDLRQMAIYYQS